MKTYRSSRELLAEVEQLIAKAKPGFQHSVLEDVIERICHGRHYTWMGIYVTTGEKAVQQLLQAGQDTQPGKTALPETRSKILVSMKLASREVGVLDVESDRENAFGAEDRVLLEKLAGVLARFLSGRGKYIVRKARQAAAASQQNRTQTRGPQSEVVGTHRSAAVGER